MTNLDHEVQYDHFHDELYRIAEIHIQTGNEREVVRRSLVCRRPGI